MSAQWKWLTVVVDRLVLCGKTTATAIFWLFDGACHHIGINGLLTSIDSGFGRTGLAPYGDILAPDRRLLPVVNLLCHSLVPIEPLLDQSFHVLRWVMDLIELLGFRSSFFLTNHPLDHYCHSRLWFIWGLTQASIIAAAYYRANVSSYSCQTDQRYGQIIATVAFGTKTGRIHWEGQSLLSFQDHILCKARLSFS